jgi:hypothetical protein
MVEEESGELARAIKLFIEYAHDKGQIPSAVDFAVLKTYLTWLETKLGIPNDKRIWSNLVDEIVELSRHEPSYSTTVWQKALELIASGTKYKMEVIEEKKKKTPIGHLGH